MLGVSGYPANIYKTQQIGRTQQKRNGQEENKKKTFPTKLVIKMAREQ